MSAPPPPVYADLHCHSTASDGEWEPEALVEAAAAAGLSAWALTDHDTWASVARAQSRGQALGVEVLAGCELTAYWETLELHLLAFFISTEEQTPLANLLQNVRDRRRARALEMGARLRAQGVAVEDSDILTAAGTAQAIGKPHVAAALVRRGHARSIREAFTRFLGSGSGMDVPKLRLGVAELLAAVHASGGIAVLAHPGIVPHDELIGQLFRLGLDGLEAHHLSHGPVNRRFYEGLARRHEKGVSGGSDFHGPRVKPGVVIGASGVTKGMLEDLRRRAEAWKASAPAQDPVHAISE